MSYMGVCVRRTLCYLTLRTTSALQHEQLSSTQHGVRLKSTSSFFNMRHVSTSRVQFKSIANRQTDVMRSEIHTNVPTSSFSCVMMLICVGKSFTSIGRIKSWSTGNISRVNNRRLRKVWFNTPQSFGCVEIVSIFAGFV